MANETIYWSTTDTIPDFSNKLVTKSEVTWAHNPQSIMAAYNGLEAWARNHGYNALIGVRFMVCPGPGGGIEFWAYGTAVAWEY